MNKFKIEGGLKRDEVYDKYGNKMGVAVYDLEDVQVKNKLVAFYNNLKEMGTKYEKEAEKLKKDISINKEDGFPNNAKELAELDLKCVNEMIDMIDDIFGKDFCVNAVGNTKNPKVIMEVLAAVANSYKIETDKEINKYVNRKERRAQTKAVTKRSTKNEPLT